MKYFYYLLFLLVFSCAKKGNDQSDLLETNVDLDASEVRNLSDKFDGIRYVLLNYSDSLPLVNPYIVRFSEDKIFVSDRVLENILVFDREGNYVYGFLSTGEGPGEFIQVDDFQLTDRLIHIQDNRLRKILTFTIEGNFVSERKNPIPSSNSFLSEDFGLHFMNNFKYGDGFNFIREDEDQTITGYFKIPDKLVGLKTALKNGFIISPATDEILLGIPNSNKVAFFDSEGYLARTLDIDLGRSGVSDDLRSKLFNGEVKYSYLNEANLCRGASAFYPFKNEYFGFFQRGGKEFHYVFFDQDFSTTFQASRLKNDLDGMIITNVPWSFKDDELVFMIGTNNFLSNYLSKEDQLKADFPSQKIHDFVSENFENLKNDKTVLAFLKVK